MAWMINSAVLYASGDIKNSLAAIQKAVELDPDNSEARFQLGFILFRAKQYKESIKEYKESLRLRPGQPAILERLAYIHIMDKKLDFYNPSAAVRFAEIACELTGYDNLQNLITLYSSYTAAGRIHEAITTVERALDIALSEDQPKVVESMRKQLLYLKSVEVME
jgi:tetratricopeptide (TPR) repeat protein